MFLDIHIHVYVFILYDLQIYFRWGGGVIYFPEYKTQISKSWPNSYHRIVLKQGPKIQPKNTGTHLTDFLSGARLLNLMSKIYQQQM